MFRPLNARVPVSDDPNLGYPARSITFIPSLKLPAGWKFGTALPIAKQDGSMAGAEGEKLTLPTIESMDYFVKGVTGSTK